MTAVKKVIVSEQHMLRDFREQMGDICEPMSFSTFKASYDPVTGVKTFSVPATKKS